MITLCPQIASPVALHAKCALFLMREVILIITTVWGMARSASNVVPGPRVSCGAFPGMIVAFGRIVALPAQFFLWFYEYSRIARTVNIVASITRFGTLVLIRAVE